MMPIHFRLRRFVAAALLLVAGVATADQGTADQAAPRAALVERIIATAEAAVANPRFVTGSQWDRFTETLRDPEIQALDDAEFRKAFNQAADRLPFTHFRLHWQQPRQAEDEDPVISLDWPSERVAHVRLREFSGDPMVIAETMSEVIASDAEALVLDLRGTPGGSFPTAVALSRALRSEPLDAGAFLTRGWFAQHGDYPDAAQYEAIAPLEVLDLGAFVDQLQRDGAARLVLPGHDQPIFEGRLVILTDGATGSTSEPLVYLLQRSGVTVIGERTAGGMLSAEHFPMDDTFKLFVPVADYVTPDLVRLDRRGVAPDVEVPAEQALEEALRLLGRG